MRVASVLIMVGTALALAGCGGGDEDTAESISVRGDEYAFIGPDEGKAGVVKLDFSNTGKELHEYGFARLAQGKTLADVQALVKSGQEEPPEWFTDVGGVPLLSPGEELSITRDLEPATYVLLCFIPSPKGEPHINLGMLKAIELKGDSGRELPEPDAVITASKGGYDIPALDAGSQTLELRNADDKEREFFLVALEPGKELADLERFFEQGEGKGTPPAEFHGAMQTIPAGTSVFLDTNLKSGVEYSISDTSGAKPIDATFTPK